MSCRPGHIAVVIFLLAAHGRALSAPRQHLGPGIPQAEAEARSFLPRCPRPGDKLRQLCLLTERNFVEQYVLAKAGDPYAMSSTASSFDVHAESEEFKNGPLYFGGTGRPFNAIEACAWRTVIFGLPKPPHGATDLELENAVCDPLAAGDRAKADDRAEVLTRELEDHRTAMPPADWEPAMPGLKE